MDIDRTNRHDFYSLDDVNEQFDVVLLFDVIEHLELDEGVQLLQQIRDVLLPEGLLMISVPNVFNPSRFWMDATHKTAYSYEELGGILLSQRFSVREIYRTFHASVPKYLLRRTLLYPLHRALNVDFAKSVLIVAERTHTSVGKGN